jgi:ATP-binding cassette subfamily B protein
MADRLYLFENGSIIEQGTHDELMELNGRYREMFDRQARNYLV